MSQYPAVIQLSSLDGGNGFRIDGGAAGEESGFSVASAGDINGDGLDDLIIGAWQGDPHGSNSGSSYVVFGTISGFGATFDLSSLDGNNGFRLDGAASGDFSGYSVASAGDVNGDGFNDLIVGARGADPHYSYSGSSYVIFGKSGGFVAALDLSNLDGQNGFRIDGVAERDFSGASVASAGDFNGDGIDDLIVGAKCTNSRGHLHLAGSAYVVFGDAAGFSATLDLESLDGTNGFTISAASGRGLLGDSVSSAGDVNGDGFADLIIGAWLTGPQGNPAGSSYVVFGKASGFTADLNVSTLDGANGFTISGETLGDTSGFSAASAGDVNGDGFADLVIGAPNADPNGNASGASYVVFGKASGFNDELNLGTLDGTNGFKISGEAAGDQSGCSVSSAGDFNGDGFDDLIVGARNADTNGNLSGESYVVFGEASGFTANLNLSALDGSNGFRLDGAAAGDSSGYSVASAGDVNGDGFDDLIVGARDADPNGTDSGASYVIYGSMPGEAVTRIGTAIANIIHGGDFDDTLTGLAGDDKLYGYDGKDTLSGGKGNDTLIGGIGRDTITGGADDDLFVYGAVSESTRRVHDTIVNPDFAADRFDVPVAVTGIDATIDHGLLSNAGFDAKLAAAVDAAHLGPNHAVLFTPDAGGLAGHTFLIIDQNGVAGYQRGEDLVMDLVGPKNLVNFDTDDFI